MNFVFNFLNLRLQYIGKAPLCNLNKERGITIFGKVFVFCYRCTGLLLSFILISLMSIVDKDIFIGAFPIYLKIIFLLVLPFDILFNSIYKIYSSNLSRFISGILFPFGLL